MTREKHSDEQLVFSKWTRWAERSSLNDAVNPGVYLLAHFDKAPPGMANPLSGRIVYIGETCRSLMKRWYEFDCSAFHGISRHSGGDSYNDMFVKKFGVEQYVNKLYVAAIQLPEICEKHRPFYIRYIERKLIWDFTQKWGDVPACNTK